jgi:predicted  nucleic acid-binding Zn-ribbon protein
MQPWWQQPFFQVALPIVITFALTYWAHNRRIDDLNRRIDDLNRRIDDFSRALNGRIDDLKDQLGKRLDAIKHRLERIEQLLTDHDRRITALEELSSPLRR